MHAAPMWCEGRGYALSNPSHYRIFVSYGG